MNIMKKLNFLGFLGLVVISVATLAPAITADVPPERQVSGKIINGYRILSVESTTFQVNFTVYRGDYIKFEFNPSIGHPDLKIPALSVRQTLPDALEKAPYFKMKQIGTFEYSLGKIAGRIMVIDYRQDHYREVTAKQAANLIEMSQPLLLDVRTPREFKAGHLKDALLIPVQELKRRLNELSDFKEQEILVYCATGNRSTVAAKILNDNGFKRVSNLRHGIYGWSEENLPVVR